MIYIRHAEKSYANGGNDTFPLDPPLTDQGIEAARCRFQHLFNTYGVPPRIVSSPFLRARETAYIAQNIIFDLIGCVVPVTYDSNIGEYLGHHMKKDINVCLCPETLALNPIPPETWKQYSQRMYIYVNSNPPDGWYITHGIVIQSIAFFKGKTINRPLELHGIQIQDNEVYEI